MHEVWCGLLLTLALASEGKRLWLVYLVRVALAALVREFAAAFLALLLAGSVVAPSDARSPGWLGLMGPVAILRALAKFS